MKRNVTSEQFEDKAFQKWWARHPWCKVSVNNGPRYFHINMLLVYSWLCVGMAILGITEIVEICKWEKYKDDKCVLTEQQMKEKYSKFQTVRYDAYTRLQQKVN